MLKELTNPSFWKDKGTVAKGFLLEKYQECISDYHTMREKSKDLVGTNYQLGLFHLYRGNLADALLRFRITLFLAPTHAMAHYHLGRCYLLRNQIKDARKYLEKALSLDPNIQEARYFLATLDPSSQIDTIPLSVIADYFNALAPDYEQTYLEDMRYQGHHLVCNALLKAVPTPPSSLSVADLGCGTGACGALLVEHFPVKTLIGVDLAEKMLEVARKKEHQGKPTYNALIHKDFTSFLSENNELFNIITAAVAFPYVGELRPVFGLMHKRLHSGGYIAFSTIDGPVQEGFQASPTLEYFYHSHAYIEKITQDSGFKIVSTDNVALYDDCLGRQYICQKN